jgi:hypothetical protein
MTTVTATPVLTPPPAFARIWNIVKLHMVNRQTYLGIPWIITGGAWVISMLIALIINFAAGPADAAKATEGMGYSWAVLSPIWYMCAVGVLAIAQSFPFALGFGVTRRDFYLGTSLMFLMTSIGNSLALATLVEIERATNGWGIGGVMFDALFFQGQPWVANVFLFSVIQLGTFFIGACIATIYMRWRVMGMTIFWLALALVLVATVALITLTYSWPAVGAWFVAQGVVGGFAWGLIPVAVAAVTGFFILRRATPRN